MRLVVLLVLLAAAVDSFATEKLPSLKVGEAVYTNVTVTMQTPTALYFTHAGGMGTAKLKDLEPALQQRFGYKPEQAQQAEQEQTRANAQYQALAAAQGAKAAAAAGPAAAAASASTTDLVWSTSLPAALKRAKAEDKCVLVLFDGSDWCPASSAFNQRILSTTPFKAYAHTNLVLVLVDFPRHLAQTAELKQTNERLAAAFNVKYYPTVILLDSKGQNLGGTLGTDQRPEVFITKLERFRTR